MPDPRTGERDTAERVADLRAAVEADREELVALCADLVAAPSENPPGDTRAGRTSSRRT